MNPLSYSKGFDYAVAVIVLAVAGPILADLLQAHQAQAQFRRADIGVGDAPARLTMRKMD